MCMILVSQYFSKNAFNLPMLKNSLNIFSILATLTYGRWRVCGVCVWGGGKGNKSWWYYWQKFNSPNYVVSTLELSYAPSQGNVGGCIPKGQDNEECNKSTCVKCKGVWDIGANKNVCETW